MYRLSNLSQRIVSAAAMTVLLVGGLALPAGAQNLDIDWSTIDSGGAMFSNGGPLELGGTIGQPDATASELTLIGGSMILAGGFWTIEAAGVDCNGNGIPDESEVVGPLNGFALDFDGVDDVVTVGGFGAIAPTTEITVEFWQKVDAAADRYALSMGSLANNVMSVNSPWSDGQVYWSFGDPGSGGQLTYTPPEPIVGVWQHFAFVASQAGNYMRIYRNGVLEAVKVGMDPRAADGSALRIGDFDVSGYSFGGLIDEFRVWNVARNQMQIQSAMNTMLTGDESGLLGYWRFNEGAGMLAADSAGFSDGTLTNGPGWTATYVDCNANYVPDTCDPDCNFNGLPDDCEASGPLSGFALEFDGVDDGVTVPAFGAIAPTTEVTVEFWQKADAVASQFTLAIGLNPVSNRFSAAVPASDGMVYWEFGDTTSGAGRLAYTPPESVTGSWQHFACVASLSGNYMRIFRNGVLEASKTGMDPREPGGQALLIGGIAGNRFGGLIDEVRIWNIARNQTQIQSTMNSQLNGDESGLLAYWRLNEGAGTLAADSAGFSDGTLVNGPAWIALYADDNANGVPDECEAACTLPGDLNNDGQRNGMDIQPFVNCVLAAGGQGCECADMDANGTIEAVADVADFVAILLGISP